MRRIVSINRPVRHGRQKCPIRFESKSGYVPMNSPWRTCDIVDESFSHPTLKQFHKCTDLRIRETVCITLLLTSLSSPEAFSASSTDNRKKKPTTEIVVSPLQSSQLSDETRWPTSCMRTSCQDTSLDPGAVLQFPFDSSWMHWPAFCRCRNDRGFSFPRKLRCLRQASGMP